METKNQIHFDCLCRTCMQELAEAYDIHSELVVKQPPQQQWQTIFDALEEFGTLQICDLLSSTIPQIKVQPNDVLPKKICHECLQELMSLYRFQKMCLKSDEEMRELISRKYSDIKISLGNSPSAINSACPEKVSTKPINTLSAEIQETATNDPLQSIDETNEHCENVEVDISTCLKMELHNDEDEFNTDCNDFEIKTPYTYDTSIKMERTTYKIKRAGEEIIATSNESDSGSANSDWTPKKRSGVVKGRNSQKPKRMNGKLKEPICNDKSPERHSCSLCKKSFNSRRYLLRHLRRHKKADERKNMPPQPKSDAQHSRFKCDICDRYFSKPKLLHKHRLMHDGKEMVADDKLPNYACNFCEKFYCSQRTLTRHKKQKHGRENSWEDTKLYTCEFCDKSFQQSGTLKDHLRTHTGEQPYLCSECGKAFNSSSNLKQHLLRHAGVRRYECPDCPKKFPCLSDLASHKAVHRRIKPHVCDICGGAFGKPYQLKKHKMYHNGEKPYKCEYCEMRFVCMDHQRRHMRTHTGEKPYKCKYCERAFAQSNDLIKHLRTHLGENVYKCELCPSGFRLAAELRVHFALHKNDDQETRERNMKALLEEETKLRLNLSVKKTQRLPQSVESSGKVEQESTAAVT